MLPAGDARTLGHGRKLGVDDVGIDRAKGGKGAEAAVGAGNHPVSTHALALSTTGRMVASGTSLWCGPS